MSSVWGAIEGLPISELNWPVPTREPSQDLDRNAFLQLLIVQLQHQDPLNPMDDRDFMAQMAQFSALEQMIQLNNTFERTQAYSMIGKFIDAAFVHPASGEWIELEDALVVSVLRQGDQTLLTVLGENNQPIDVPIDAVRTVTGSSSNHLIEGIWNQMTMQRAQDMVGRYIQAIIQNGDNLEFIEGRVSAANLDGMGRAVLQVGTREVFVHEVTSVAAGMRLIGSTNFTHGGAVGDEQWTYGRLDRVDIVNAERAYLVFANGTRQRIDRINQATEAVQFVGQRISYGNVSGTVRSITIVGNIPFLNVYRDDNTNAGRIDMLAYLVQRAGGRTDDDD